MAALSVDIGNIDGKVGKLYRGDEFANVVLDPTTRKNYYCAATRPEPNTNPPVILGGRRRRGSRRLNRTKKPKMNRKRRGSRRR